MASFKTIWNQYLSRGFLRLVWQSKFVWSLIMYEMFVCLYKIVLDDFLHQIWAENIWIGLQVQGTLKSKYWRKRNKSHPCLSNCRRVRAVEKDGEWILSEKFSEKCQRKIKWNKNQCFRQLPWNRPFYFVWFVKLPNIHRSVSISVIQMINPELTIFDWWNKTKFLANNFFNSAISTQKRRF